MGKDLTNEQRRMVLFVPGPKLYLADFAAATAELTLPRGAETRENYGDVKDRIVPSMINGLILAVVNSAISVRRNVKLRIECGQAPSVNSTSLTFLQRRCIASQL